MSRNRAIKDAPMAGTFTVVKSTGAPHTSVRTLVATMAAMEYNAAWDV